MLTTRLIFLTLEGVVLEHSLGEILVAVLLGAYRGEVGSLVEACLADPWDGNQVEPFQGAYQVEGPYPPWV